MRKIIIILLMFILTISLFIWCSNNSVNKSKEISSIEVIRQSDKNKWSLSDKDTIDKFAKELNNR
jgi:predicted ATPase